MILGTGIDVVDVASFAEQLAEPGTAFSRVFTARERRQARARALAHAAPGSARSDEAEHLAVRWAAKEAFVKAWSAALWGSEPVLPDMAWHEVEVVADAWHRPRLAVHGRVAEMLAGSLGPVRMHVSLSHDGPVAVASAIIESDGRAEVGGGVRAKAGPGLEGDGPDGGQGPERDGPDGRLGPKADRGGRGAGTCGT